MGNISKIGTNCCGCRACGQICPVTAIAFQSDTEGFIQPHIDSTICINCGKCLKICPIENPNVFDQAQQIGYAAKITAKNHLAHSSSGGIFYALAKTTIDNGGFVCGCGTDHDFMPVHRMISDLKEIRNLQGSKYVQSDMNTIFTQTRERLEEGSSVLFSGTPCQIAGLRNFLGKDYPQLYCIDLICHGVPSRKLYAAYLEWLGKNRGGKVIRHEFRNKQRHKWSLTMRADIEMHGGKVKKLIRMASLDPYYHNFLQGTTYRESCYKCPYAQPKRTGDLTIGDFWGVEKTHPHLYDINGVSCVLINTNKGKLLWSKATPLISSEQVTIEAIIKFNGNLQYPTKRPALRDQIYKRLNRGGGFDAVPYDISTSDYAIDTIKNFIPNILRQKIKIWINRIRH